ncbi:benzoate/H(+) symporter BenE family transporter [Brenneria goodwinii]|uniref:benzoate/H(+) symporter BenE family transporter n=1 Tax=Brenneria goodwinii TaxID=1109412 RepID=UPI001F20C891|nr:benzoate/H(+) symporter BenE family transporter [Brenneria goodwinii]
MAINHFIKDYSSSAMITGFIAVLVSYAGPFAIVFQAANTINMPAELVTSWVWAISIGSAVTGISLSLYYKMPIITAWSTPGAALLVASLAHYRYEEVVGAFLISGMLIFILGITGLFQKIMKQIPSTISAAMLAGILFHFGESVFKQLEVNMSFVLPLIISYLIGKRLYPRYAILSTLVIGFALVGFERGLNLEAGDFSFATPIFTMPEFSTASIIGLAIPLCIVTMTSQNVPGLAVLNADGYRPNANPLIYVTGLISIVLAPFGAHGINLAAITAAICTGRESHENAGKRYASGVFCGFFYLIIGLFGAAVASVFFILPQALIATIAGLALFSSLGNGLALSMRNEKEREAALVTFLVTVSGFSFFGIGSAFWGLIGGMLTHVLVVYQLILPSNSGHVTK